MQSLKILCPRLPEGFPFVLKIWAMIRVSRNSSIFNSKKKVLLEKRQPTKAESFWRTFSDLNRTNKIFFTRKCLIFKFYANGTLNIIIKTLRKVFKLKEIKMLKTWRRLGLVINNILFKQTVMDKIFGRRQKISQNKTGKEIFSSRFCTVSHCKYKRFFSRWATGH